MWILFKVLWPFHLETVNIGQGHPLVHHLLTKLDQLGKLELDRQAEHFKNQLDAGEAWTSGGDTWGDGYHRNWRWAYLSLTS